jgi:hypothetical protein
MMRRTAALPTAALFAAALVAGCNSSRQAPPPPPAETPAAALPEGSGCAAAIARYRAIQQNDLDMGHVNKSVYAQIQKEIAEAQSACAYGEEAKAQSLLRASKAKHGYPE